MIGENTARGIMINFTMNCGLDEAKKIISQYNGYIINNSLWDNCGTLTIETPLSYRAVMTSLNSVHRNFVQNTRIVD